MGKCKKRNNPFFTSKDCQNQFIAQNCRGDCCCPREDCCECDPSYIFNITCSNPVDPVDPSTKPVIIDDTICGNINMPCGTEKPSIIWEGTFTQIFGTITFYYASGCDQMEIWINQEKAITLKSGQTRSITASNLHEIAIRCDGNGGICSGTYELCLHYKKP